MAGRLKGRLARMRDLGLVKASDMQAPGRGAAGAAGEAAAASKRKSSSRQKATLPPFLEGWERAGELAWTRTLRKGCSLPERIDARPFARISPRSMAAKPPVAEVGPEPIYSDRLRFFDFETTGLSGGTGTIAFLAAVARRDGDELVVRQFFLEDYPGELAFLDALLAEFDEDSVLATYNGSSFDLPLLRTRCVMNGIAAPSRPHIDALFAARRLWKRPCGGAALGLLEREVLGVERDADVPGSMIPSLYFSYLRSGDEPLMPIVMSHNADDVASLAALLARAHSIFANPRRHSGSSSVDRAGLGRSLLSAGREAEGEELLEAALGDGDEAAGLLLSRRYRRAGRTEERGRIVGMLPDSYRSDVERAKFFERSGRDLGEALKWAIEAGRLASNDEEAAAVDRRVARLRRKLAAAG